jgi:hypothetical protein
MPYSLHKSGNEIPDSTRLSASMIWLSVIRTFFISVEPFRWKIFYFSALRIFGGITTLRSLNSDACAREKCVLHTPPGDTVANASQCDEIGEGFAFVKNGFGIPSQRGLDAHGRQGGGLHAQNVMQL